MASIVSSGSRGGAVAAADVELHELAKGWKAAIARATDPTTKHEARVKNDRGNLPLHSAASFRCPIEVTEALLESYPEGASLTNNYGNLALHFAAWKKGPLESEKLLLSVFPEGAAQKNNHGNLPLHYAAHYNAPLEVVEALYNAYPEAAHQKNNDSNTPLDLAIADGASPNVVALLQGKSVPPTDDEVFESAKARCERMESELQRAMETHDDVQEDMEAVLSLLMETVVAHPQALYFSGIDPKRVSGMDSLLHEVRKSFENERKSDGLDESSLGAHTYNRDEEDELQMIEDALVPLDDEVEVLLSQIVGLDFVKNQIRGMRRTIEQSDIWHRTIPRHIAIFGNPGVGKTHVARILSKVMYLIGAVVTENCVEVGRSDLVDRKSEARTIAKTRSVLKRASGGVLFVDEPYTLFPSQARPRGRDHGSAALKELARGLDSGSPLVIMGGQSSDLQKVLSCNVGFKNNVLIRFELPELLTVEIVRIFFMKMIAKGYVPADSLTIQYTTQLLENNTDEEWRLDRNGRVADLLVDAVRVELKNKVTAGDNYSRESMNPKKLQIAPGQKIPVSTVEEILVTAEDLQNAVMNGL